MYAGAVMERAPRRDALLPPPPPLHARAARPRCRPRRRADRLTPIPGQPPSLISLPAGCPFAPAVPVRVRPLHE